jgi:hypothetical protein
MRIKVTSVKALEKYSIFIQFNDGTGGVLDLAAHAGRGVFKSWEENDNFSKVFISEESGAITWPEEIDIDTLNAWFIVNHINPEDYLQSQRRYAEYQ